MSPTIPPPPPVDRERDTQPPKASDFPPPELITLADKHTQRLTAIEAHLVRIERELASIAGNIQMLVDDARQKRMARNSLRNDLDELTTRVDALAEAQQS